MLDGQVTTTRVCEFVSKWNNPWSESAPGTWPWVPTPKCPRFWQWYKINFLCLLLATTGAGLNATVPELPCMPTMCNNHSCSFQLKGNEPWNQIKTGCRTWYFFGEVTADDSGAFWDSQMVLKSTSGIDFSADPKVESHFDNSCLPIQRPSGIQHSHVSGHKHSDLQFVMHSLYPKENLSGCVLPQFGFQNTTDLWSHHESKMQPTWSHHR